MNCAVTRGHATGGARARRSYHGLVMPGTSFGPNEWLVEEMYDRFRADPESVGPSWREFFANYRQASAPPRSVAAHPADAAAAPTPPAAPDGDHAPASTGDGDQARRSTGDGDQAQPLKGDGDQAQPLKGDGDEARRSTGDGDQAQPLKGVAARIVANMEASLSVPTATSVRRVPAKLLEINRTILNNHLARRRGGKVSFTHLIGFAVVRALRAVPVMNSGFRAGEDGKPTVTHYSHVNLGLAVDVENADRTRSLIVPAIKHADEMDFHGFWSAYEDLIRKVRTKKLSADDLAGVTVSLTNPGTLGTEHSVPRLMPGQGVIVGVGALEYPAEFSAADPSVTAQLGLSKVLTLTSTYDHRIIQGAESGLFLGYVHECLIGGHGFYDDVFESMGVPYAAVKWQHDSQVL